MAQVNKRKAREARHADDCCGGLAALLSPRLFRALADPKRLSLLVRMAEAQCPCTVSEIAGGSGVDLSVVSRHLAILRDVGIIGCVKHGKQVWCSLQPAAVVRILRALADALEGCCPEGACPPPAPSSPPTALARSSKPRRQR
jgi:DNA-binding transcriptional ArsR family regulator